MKKLLLLLFSILISFNSFGANYMRYVVAIGVVGTINSS